MTAAAVSVNAGAPRFLPRARLDDLLAALGDGGRRVVGPTVAEDGIGFAELHPDALHADDLAVVDPLLEEVYARHPVVTNPAGRCVSIEGYEFIGLNLVSDFPFRLKDRARMDMKDFSFPRQFGGGLLSIPGGWREIPDWPSYARTLPTIEEELAKLPTPADCSRAVYVIHGPPSGLSLDVCRGGERVGSAATLRFLERRQPLLSLHGHIHESPEGSGAWKASVGRTVVIQPGQSAEGLTVVFGNLETMEFERRVVAP